MIRWCAYCHHFLQEVEPFERYQICYEVCATCKPTLLAFSAVDQEKLESIVAYFIRLEEIALAGTPSEVANILDEGLRMGTRPLDLLMGMVQPLLTKIGDLWASNRLSVTTEHRFSSLVAALVAQVRVAARPVAQPPSPALVLVNAEENYHTLGLQMAEVYFESRGIPTLVVTPGLPTREVLELVDFHRPLALGFSVALAPQMKQVREVAEQFKKRPGATQRILLGGPAMRLGLPPDPPSGVEVCRDLASVQVLLTGRPLTRYI